MSEGVHGNAERHHRDLLRHLDVGGATGSDRAT
jgi:hypothetical protein